jgi:hypothetical protein
LVSDRDEKEICDRSNEDAVEFDVDDADEYGLASELEDENPPEPV